MKVLWNFRQKGALLEIANQYFTETPLSITTMVETIDLTEDDIAVVSSTQPIDLCSSSSSSSDDEDLAILCDPFASFSSTKVRQSEENSSMEFTYSDDDSSIGIGNSYGDFYPLYELKKSIAPFGYEDFHGNDDCLSQDSWYLDRCWWLDVPKTAVWPLSSIFPSGRISQNSRQATNDIKISSFLAHATPSLVQKSR